MLEEQAHPVLETRNSRVPHCVQCPLLITNDDLKGGLWCGVREEAQSR